MKKNPFVTKEERQSYKKFTRMVKRYAKREGKDYEALKESMLFGNANRRLVMESDNKRSGYIYQGLKKED